MEDSNCPVLAAVRDLHEETERAVTSGAIARDLGRQEEAVATRLSDLVACELVKPVGHGYRPTVTGREFLNLDIDCGPIIVDTDGSE